MADFARGQLLIELREAKHLSQEDAAHEIGVSAKSLRAWEHGGKIRWPNAKRVGEFYGVDPERLVSREAGDEDEDEDALPALDDNMDIREQLDRIEQRQELILAALGITPEISEAEEAARAFEEVLDRQRREQPGMSAATGSPRAAREATG